MKKVAAILAGAVFVWALMPFLPDSARAFPAPHASTLSFSPAAGFDGTDAINPNTAPINTPLTFSVVYTHPDNHPPVFASIFPVLNRFIPTAYAHEDNGEEEGMKLFVNTAAGFPLFFTQLKLYRDTTPDPAFPHLHDGDYANGEQFSITVPDGFPYVANYEFYFEATDGEHWRYLGRPFVDGPFTFTLSTPPPPLPPARNPLILIPGISGSELYHQGEEVWMNIGKILTDDHFLDVLAMNNLGDSLVPIEVGDIIREKLGVFRIWTQLIHNLEQDGYVEGLDLFVFPYDWRLDNRVNADALANAVDQILQNSPASKVDIIAHSMGGLVSKEYLRQHGEEKVDQLIFLGTPHFGAPKALKILMYGDDFSTAGIVNPDSIKRLVANMRTVYQLLPTTSFFNAYTAYVVDMGDYDRNGVRGALNFSQTQTFIGNVGLNTYVRDVANVFHSDLSAWSPSSSLQARTHAVVGCAEPTIGRIVTFRGFEDDDDVNVQMIDGDETVPLQSAQGIANGTTYFLPPHKTLPHAGLRDGAPVGH